LQEPAQFAAQKSLKSNQVNNYLRFVYVVSRKAALIRTIEVLDGDFIRNFLNRIKRESVLNYKSPYNEILKETRERYFSNNHKQNIVK
jgi:energy-converting hydrogenase A subunit M